MAGMAAGHDSVEIRAEAEEGDVTEVEQPGEPDDDIQAEREQGVDDGDEPVAEEVPLVRDEREDRERPDQDREPPGGRYALPAPANETGEAPLGLAALVDVRDPFVDADTRLVDDTGSRRNATREVRGHQSLRPSGSQGNRGGRSGGRGTLRSGERTRRGWRTSSRPGGSPWRTPP